MSSIASNKYTIAIAQAMQNDYIKGKDIIYASKVFHYDIAYIVDGYYRDLCITDHGIFYKQVALFFKLQYQWDFINLWARHYTPEDHNMLPSNIVRTMYNIGFQHDYNQLAYWLGADLRSCTRLTPPGQAARYRVTINNTDGSETIFENEIVSPARYELQEEKKEN